MESAVFGPIALAAMALVIVQAVRDLVQGENRAPWPFFTHMIGLRSRPGVVVGLLLYAAVMVTFFVLVVR